MNRTRFRTRVGWIPSPDCGVFAYRVLLQMEAGISRSHAGVWERVQPIKYIAQDSKLEMGGYFLRIVGT